MNKNSKNVTINIVDKFCIFVVAFNSFYLPFSTIAYDIWHLIYGCISIIAFTDIIIYYDKIIKEKDAEIKYLENIIKESKDS